MDPDPALEKEIYQQVAKLARFYDRIMNCTVLVAPLGGRRKGNPCHVRIDLGLPQATLVVEHEPSLHATAKDTADERASKKMELRPERKNPARAVHDAFGEMRRRLQDYARKQRGDTKTSEEPQEAARVVQLVPDENYGFCATEDGRLVYFHRNSVTDGRFEGLRVGSKVKLVQELGEKGPQATTLHVVRPRKQAQIAAATVPARKSRKPKVTVATP